MEIILHFHFHFKVFSERERERKREREERAQIGEREEEEPRSRRRSRSIAPITILRSVDRHFVRWRRRSRSEIAISRSTAPFARSRSSRTVLHEIALCSSGFCPSNPVERRSRSRRGTSQSSVDR